MRVRGLARVSSIFLFSYVSMDFRRSRGRVGSLQSIGGVFDVCSSPLSSARLRFVAFFERFVCAATRVR